MREASGWQRSRTEHDGACQWAVVVVVLVGIVIGRKTSVAAIRASRHTQPYPRRGCSHSHGTLHHVQV